MWKSIRSGWLDFSKYLQFNVGDGTSVKSERMYGIWIVLLKKYFQNCIVLVKQGSLLCGHALL